ncbi:hypothetical protein BV509_01045 [Rhodovulum sulfidophilum]|uniref:Helix-turn-helix domain-containing protein n=1 Tax=Rhodovulum visakhapatnamense TaxID=364297 RepID=A0ABS1RGK0_9RHOB|nr:helix-turn-helix domain-containing protein [Rhodovulum visakhapatnamense]MBL3569922.1 helix-turn-helix domain-containing protein [Rhodovulum visakhapatnamense]MBL3578385.1 helix-turn-helix domain-containing protein [Rhodovulum visakhapatnamense]OLS43074.1 hypothetical protein BV509_01045 [Rhodovulum sulfidophilum]
MDALSPEERRLIDEAVAAGRVTEVPTGASAHSSYVWDQSKKTLVMREPYAPKSWAHRKGGRPANPALAARRQSVRVMVAEGGRTGAEMAQALGVSEAAIWNDLKVLGLNLKPVTHGLPQGLSDHNAARAAAVEDRRSRIADMAARDMTRTQIAEAFGVSPRSLYADIAALGLDIPDGRRQARKEAAAPAAEAPEAVRDGAAAPAPIQAHDKAAAKRIAQADRKRAAIRDRRRFKTGVVADGRYAKMVPADATCTVHGHMLADPGDGEAVLKNGAMNAKIGGDVLVGRLRGARIFTLTLEERATCPRSCAHWRGCYGNAMHYARRWRHGPALEAALRRELSDLCAAHDLVLIRLHVLGDFYSLDYVALWHAALRTHRGLAVFGFTAHPDDSEIGRAIRFLREAHHDRFMIRHSGRTGVWGSFDITDPEPEKRIGDAIVCPEQRAANRGDREGVHCGTCAVCWSTDRPIAFIRH